MDSLSTMQKRKKLREWLKDKFNLSLVILLGIVICVRLYYFFKLGSQPIWWDEGDYLAIAKVWALNMETPEWWSHFTGMRPLLLPLIWAGMMKIGLGEMALRFFTILIPSIATTWLCFALGKSLYNKRVGLIAAGMMSFYWVFSFYSYRLLTDVPALFTGLLSFYFFWEHYIRRKKPYGLYLCFLFGVVAFSLRFPLALVPVTCAIYLIAVRRTALFKDKTIWKSIALGILFISPYAIYFILNRFALFSFYFGDKSVHAASISWDMLPFILSLLESGWIVPFIIGLGTFYTVFLYVDIIFKQKEHRFNADFFIVIWIFAHIIFYMVIFKGYTDRWLLMLMPAIFIVCGKGSVTLYDFIKKYHKTVAFIVVMSLVGFGLYQNVNHGSALIEEKKDSYQEVKFAGLWIKDNSDSGSKVFTSSVVQNQYYSERDSYDLRSEDPIWERCTDMYGAVIKNESCQEETLASFEKKVALVNPDYFIISVFEPVFTPEWAYSYASLHNLTAERVYTDGAGNPLLIIYKF